MAVGPYSWSLTAGDNGSADTNINFSEGQSPASLNNSARALMAAVAGWIDTLGGVTFGGAGNAYTATNQSVAVWASYASGMVIGFVPNATNSGAATLNVDGLGVKSIVKGASTAVASGDLLQNAFYMLRYNGTNFQIINQPPDVLDPTLVAIEALSWSSGSPLVQFTAADTVSLTLTPTVSSVTASQGAANTTASATFTNTTDSAAVRIARFDGDRATPAANDQGYISYYMSDGAGTQKEMVRTTVFAADVTAGAEDARWLIGTLSGGSITTRLHLSSTEIRPGTNDGYALGASTIGFSDLFLASGAVINFNNGNVILAHNDTQAVVEATTGKLVSGLKASTETSGTLTVASRNRVVNCSGGVTLDDGVFATDDWLLFDPGTSARTFTRDAGLTMYVNGIDSATATLSANQIGGAYWRSASVVVLSGAFT